MYIIKYCFCEKQYLGYFFTPPMQAQILHYIHFCSMLRVPLSINEIVYSKFRFLLIWPYVWQKLLSDVTIDAWHTYLQKYCQHVPNIHKRNVHTPHSFYISCIRCSLFSLYEYIYIDYLKKVLRDNDNLLMMFLNILQVCTDSFVYRGYVSFHVIWGRSTQYRIRFVSAHNQCFPSMGFIWFI